MSAEPDDQLAPKEGFGASPRRKPRSAVDLASILDSVDARPQSPPPSPSQDQIGITPSLEEQLSNTNPERENQSVILPAGLEKYLSPDLWRKINGTDVRRGILVNALEQLRSLLYLFSTYLPGHLVQEKMNHPVPGIVKGQIISGSLLFSDVSGFTALSEKLEALGPQGAERMTTLMNEYFTKMLEILSWSGGILIKFAGDAMLVYFPAQENNAESEWAVRAGLRMLRAMPSFSDIQTPSGKVELKMKIGIASGEFLAAAVGDAERMEYVILGNPVMQTMNAEGSATAGQLVADRATVGRLGSKFRSDEIKNAFYLVTYPDEELDDFELRAERRRARGAIPWSASPQSTVVQMEVALKQIEALKPFLAYELVERIIFNVRQRRFESEYRPTTVMFCNFTGLEPIMPLLGKEAPQRVTGLLNAFFVSANQIITRYGGMVSRIDPYKNGSKMLVLFGAPVTHEDDPQRAVSAALALNSELASLNERWLQRLGRLLPEELRPTQLLNLRIGITQGITFAGLVGSSSRREYTVMGDEVNLAARLMSAAEAGQVLISLGVYNDVNENFQTTSLSPIKVKGKSKPIQIFQVEGPRQDILQSRVRHRNELIAREAELGVARTAVEKALINSNPQILWITGPAGSGKSHFADKVVEAATGMHPRLLFFQAHAYLAETEYAGWSALLRSICNITSLDGPIVMEQKLTRFITMAGVNRDQSMRLSTLMGVKLPEIDTPDADKGPDDLNREGILRASSKWTRRSGAELWEQLETSSPYSKKTSSKYSHETEVDPYLDAVCFVLSFLAKIQPLLIVFEDAHNLDDASQRLLIQIAKKLTDIPALFIVIRRDENNIDLSKGQVIRLAYFDQSSTASLMSHILINELAPIIYHQTDGNPLLIEQITRWLQKSRKIAPDDLTSFLQSSDILQKLILSSLETLPESHREVARAASIIGYEFRSGELKAILPQIDSSTLSLYTRELSRNQIIVLGESGVDPQYRFNQSLVRDILYNSIPYERRREYHTLLAEYLASARTTGQVQSRLAFFLGSERSAPDSLMYQTIGYHYAQAGLWLQSAENYLNASKQHAQSKHYEKASEFCQLAFDATDRCKEGAEDPSVKELRSKILYTHGEVLYFINDLPQAINNLETSLSIHAAPDMVREITINLALLLPAQNRTAESEQLLRGLTKSSIDPDLRLLASLVWIAMRLQREDTLEWLRKAQEVELSQPNSWIRAMLLDLAGKSDQALAGYLANNLPLGAALIHLKQFQVNSPQLESEEFTQFLRVIEDLFEPTRLSASGAALAHYYLARIFWINKNHEKSRLEILKAQEFLEKATGKTQKDGRDATRKALKAIENPKNLNWPDWSVTEFEDDLYRSILFQPHF